MPHSQAAPTKSRRHAARMVFPTDLSTCSVHNRRRLPRPKPQKGLTGLGKHAAHVKPVHPHKVIHIRQPCYIVQQTLFRQLLAGFCKRCARCCGQVGLAENAAFVSQSSQDRLHQPRTPHAHGQTFDQRARSAGVSTSRRMPASSVSIRMSLAGSISRRAPSSPSSAVRPAKKSAPKPIGWPRCPA